MFTNISLIIFILYLLAALWVMGISLHTENKTYLTITLGIGLSFVAIATVFSVWD